MAFGWKRKFVVTLAVVSLMFAGSCNDFHGAGGGGGGGTTVTTSTFNIQINLGDAPADGVAVFQLTVTNIQLVAGTNNFTVLNTPMTLEYSRSAGTLVPVSTVNIPGGPFDKAIITFTTPVVTIIDPVTTFPRSLTPTLGSTSATVTLASPITINSNSGGVVNVELDLANSLSGFDYVNGKVTVNPVFKVNGGNVAATNQTVESGTYESVIATVNSTTSNTLTATLTNGKSLTFLSSSSTVFVNASGLGGLPVGTLVELDGNSAIAGGLSGNTDVNLTLTRVEAKIDAINGGNLVNVIEDEGYLIVTFGPPAVQLNMLVRQGTGIGAALPGSALVTFVNPNTIYTMQTTRVALANLPFTPFFDTNHIYPGQNVAIDASVLAPTPFTANHVKLLEQSLTGVVSNYTPGTGGAATFTLTVANDSAFALLTGAVTLDVFQQPTTTLVGISSVANGNTVRPRGLLFFDAVPPLPVNRHYKLVCSRILGP